MKRSSLFYGMTVLFIIQLLNFPMRTGVAAEPLQSSGDVYVGVWKGSLTFGSTQLRVIFTIDRDDRGELRGTMDSPDQGAKGIPIDAVTIEGDQLVLNLRSIGGEFRGAMETGGNTIRGDMRQAGTSLPLVLTRSSIAADNRKPQDPRPPYPYVVQEATFANDAAKIRLAGVLTLPDTMGRYPAVALISGSGPQDRDQTIQGHRPFWVIADYLTRRGVAVLRYDDRGVGDSEGEFGAATTDDFAGDALAAVRFLQDHPNIDADNVGLIGHSEGGIVGPIAASQSPDIAFLVLMAAPGLRGDSLLYRQAAETIRATGGNAELSALNNAFQRVIFSAALQEPDNAAAKARIRMQLGAWDPADLRKLGLSDAGVEQSIAQTLTPWFRYFLAFDPTTALQKVRCPVLVINGAKDVQVPALENTEAIKRALHNGGASDVTVEILDGLNHLFQTADTGAPNEYGAIEETFAPRALELIGDWLTQRR